MKGTIRLLALSLVVGFLAACGSLPARTVPTALPITQVQPSHRAPEYVFCDLKGGAWGCEDASRKTALNANAVVEPRSADGYAILPRQQHPATTPAPLLTVFFDFNSDRVSDEQVMGLLQLSKSLKAAPRITVTGFTDNVGPEHYNGFLAQRRAAAVKRLLIENGISPASIHAFGKGKCCYIENNNLSAGRAKNRRVTISL